MLALAALLLVSPATSLSLPSFRVRAGLASAPLSATAPLQPAAEAERPRPWLRSPPRPPQAAAPPRSPRSPRPPLRALSALSVALGTGAALLLTPRATHAATAAAASAVTSLRLAPAGLLVRLSAMFARLLRSSYIPPTFPVLYAPLLRYGSIPLVAGLLNWATNRLAILMMFYPLKFVGVGPIGWQGIVPGKARSSERPATALCQRTARDGTPPRRPPPPPTPLPSTLAPQWRTASSTM